MNAKPPAPRSRLQELLAIPERDRTDEQWDELHELELQNAPALRGMPQNRNPSPRNISLPSSGPLNPNPGKKRGRQRFRHGQKKNRPPRQG